MIQGNGNSSCARLYKDNTNCIVASKHVHIQNWVSVDIKNFATSNWNKFSIGPIPGTGASPSPQDYIITPDLDSLNFTVEVNTGAYPLFLLKYALLAVLNWWICRNISNDPVVFKDQQWQGVFEFMAAGFLYDYTVAKPTFSSFVADDCIANVKWVDNYTYLAFVSQDKKLWLITGTYMISILPRFS